MSLSKLLLAALTATLFLTSCSKDKGEKKEPKTQGQVTATPRFGSHGQLLMAVTDLQGQPLANAQVLISDALNQPFANNFITTDAQGQFEAPADWDSEQVVTISAPGYLRASYFGQIPLGQNFQLRSSKTGKNFELKGNGVGFKVVDKDGLVDFGLMLPVLNRQDLFAFDPNKVISPEVDVISVYGQKLEIPSNVSLPKQKEKYGIFTVTLDKPAYRMYFPEPGRQIIYTARGQFPFEKVAKEMQNGKSFLDVINYFSIKGGSLREIDITQPKQTQDLPVNELNFTDKRSFRAPAFSSDETLLAVPVSLYKGGMIPTDLKNVTSNSTNQMTVASGSEPQLLVVLQKKPAKGYELNDGRLSAVLMNFTDGVQPMALPLMEKPQMVSPNEIHLRLIPQPEYVHKAATYVLMSTVEQVGKNTQLVTRRWEAYMSEWRANVRLPKWPNEVAPKLTQRWEVSLVGADEDKGVDLGPGLLDTVSHATYSSADF